MRFSRMRRGIGLLVGASFAFASPMQPLRAQTAAPASSLVDQLVGSATPADIDVAALRQQAIERIKSKADATALKRPPIAPQLLKLPQLYTFLVIDHTAAIGRREANLTLSQRRADSIREVLAGTFKISPKRLQALGLGEEQLQDSSRPTSPANVRAQIVTIGEVPVAVSSQPTASSVPPAKKGPATAKKRH